LNGNLRVEISHATTPNAYMSQEKGSPCDREYVRTKATFSRNIQTWRGVTEEGSTTFLTTSHTLELLMRKVSGADHGADP
jgi:hypothetical protein